MEAAAKVKGHLCESAAGARRHPRRRRKRVRRRQSINKLELKNEKADFLNFARDRTLRLLFGTHASAKAKESRSAGDSDSQCDRVDDRARHFAEHRRADPHGKIAAIGKNLEASAEAKVIDASGKYLMPGIIDCHSHSMLDAINEGTLSVSSMARTRDVLNPTDVDLYRELAGGVTTLNLLHGSANSIGGQTTTVKIKYGRPIEEFIFPGAPPGIKFALGENPKRSSSTPQPGQQRRYPATRMGVEETIRDAFVRARDYKKSWDEYRADEILILINIANEFGFKVRTFQHVLEGYKVAKEIAEHGAGASTFADFWGYKIEAYDAIAYNTAILVRHGVNTSVNSDSNERARRLNIEAAKAMRYGDLTEEEALKLITINPAWQLGIQDRVGSIEVGKDADLAIWNAHPLSVYARVDTTLIDGEVFFDRHQDLARRADLEKERATLEQAEPNRPARTGGPPTAPRGRRPADEDDDIWEGDIYKP